MALRPRVGASRRPVAHCSLALPAAPAWLAERLPLGFLFLVAINLWFQVLFARKCLDERVA